MIDRFLAENAWIQNAIPVLVDTALKGAILVVIAAIGTYLLRNRSAAARHAVWTAAVIGHLAIPVFAYVLPSWRLPLLPQAPWTGVTATSEPTAPVGSVGNTPTATANAPRIDTKSPSANGEGPDRSGQPTNNLGAVPPDGRRAPSPLSILAAIWVAGAVIVLLRLAIGTWRVGQLAREGARVEDGTWLSLTQRLANRLGVSRPLTLLRGESLAVPVTWGIVYPAVLLPQDADTWPEERRRFVLVHEMAHVKRFDALTQLLAQFSLALFWFDPLVWLASHRMRVEREHACDDYVLRDGTTPSLYAGELLEMVRSIGTPQHDRAAPAFAALAMARRSEFEGRMLAILDPRLDRHTLNRKGTLMTALILAFLTLPLAALRPYEQARTASDAAPTTEVAPEVAVAPPTSPQPEPSVTSASASTPAAPAPNVAPSVTKVSAAWSCNTFRSVSSSTSTHISHHDDGSDQRLQYVQTSPGRCIEAAVIGLARFSPDETRVTSLAPGGFARFRELISGRERAVSITRAPDGGLAYAAIIDGRSVPYDAEMQAWLARFLPTVLREAGINVPARVARLRAEGGVPAVLREVSAIRSTGAKRSHYEELLKSAPIPAGDASRLVAQAGEDLAASSGDLSAVLQKLPRGTIQNASRQALVETLSRIKSSGDKARTLEKLAPDADRETLLVLAKAAEDLPSSGDKANFLTSTVSEYLTAGDAALRDAFFRTAATLQSDGDLQNVLVTAMPFGHGNGAIVMQVIRTTTELQSSGDIAVVLRNLATQRLLTPGNSAATLAVIERTRTMGSSGDRAMVLTTVARNGLLSTPAVREAYTNAAMALPSEGDRSSALAAAARY